MVSTGVLGSLGKFVSFWHESNSTLSGGPTDSVHHEKSRRLKRQTQQRSAIVCPVTLVADSFYAQGVGDGDFHTAATSMVSGLMCSFQPCFLLAPTAIILFCVTVQWVRLHKLGLEVVASMFWIHCTKKISSSQKKNSN